MTQQPLVWQRGAYEDFNNEKGPISTSAKTSTAEYFVDIFDGLNILMGSKKRPSDHTTPHVKKFTFDTNFNFWGSIIVMG